MKKIVFLSVFGLLASAPAAALADLVSDPSQIAPDNCVRLIQKCSAQSGLNRANCLFSTSNHPFCDGTELGELAYQRWALTPIDERETGSASLLGTNIVNDECISNFDNRFAALLQHTHVHNDALRQLTSTLESCREEVGADLFRP